MGSNLDILQEIGALVKETREIKLEEYSPNYKGKVLHCWVNAPGVLDELLLRAETRRDYDDYRAVVSILFEIPLETVKKLDDDFMLWLFGEGSKQYKEFHDFLRKSSPDGSERSAIPSTSGP